MKKKNQKKMVGLLVLLFVFQLLSCIDTGITINKTPKSI